MSFKVKRRILWISLSLLTLICFTGCIKQPIKTAGGLNYSVELTEKEPLPSNYRAPNNIQSTIDNRLNTSSTSNSLVQIWNNDQIFTGFPLFNGVNRVFSIIGQQTMKVYKRLLDSHEDQTTIKTGTILIFSIDLTKKDPSQTDAQVMADTKTKIDNLLLSYGILDPLVQIRNDNQIYIEISLVDDVNGLINIIEQPSILEFKEQQLDASGNIVNDASGNPLWIASTALGSDGVTQEQLTGKYLQQAFVTIDNYGKPEVGFNWNTEGATLFEQITIRLLNKPLAIFLNNVLIYEPLVNAVITKGGVIQNLNITIDEARTLAATLNSSSLAVPLVLVHQEDLFSTPMKTPAAVPDETIITGSIPLPSQIPTDPKSIGVSLLFTSFLVVVFYFAVTLFNSTFKENYDTIQSWVKKIRTLFRTKNPTTGSQLSRVSKSRQIMEIIFILLLTAVINSVINPSIGFNLSSFIIFIAIIGAVAVSTFSYNGVRILAFNKFFQIPATIKAYPLAILLAVISVVISRLVSFHPAFIFGFVGAFTLLPSTIVPDKRQRSISIILGSGVVIVLALVAFLLREPLASVPNGFWKTMLDTILGALFLGNLERLLLGLVPFTFLDGGTLASWRKIIWFVLFGIVVFLFVFIMLNKNDALSNAAKDMKVIVIIVLALASLVLSWLFWLYFRIRAKARAR